MHSKFFATICLALFAMLTISSLPAYAQVSSVEVLGVQAATAEQRANTRGRVDTDEAADADADAEPDVELTDEEIAEFEAQAEELTSGLLGRVVTTLGSPFLLGLFLVIWVKVGDWVNRDSQINSIGHRKWNSIYFFPFAIMFLLLLFVPVAHWIRFVLLGVTLVSTVIPYVVVHNKNVEPHETVLTRGWWRQATADALGKVGVKVSAERKAEYEKGAAVDLMAMGSDDPNVNNANLLNARQSPGYLLLKDLIVEIVQRNSDRVLLDYTQQAVNVRHEIDGVWHNADPRDRESGDVMLAVVKTLANMNVKERRKKQKGQFGAKFQGKSLLCPVSTQGVATGERVIISILSEKHHFKSYEELGMREGLRDKWAAMMAIDQGMVILSTMPGGGLTAITDVSINETDRLMRDFVAIEDKHHPEADIQNVNVHTYDSAVGETPSTHLPTIIRTYPNVYVVRDMVNKETAELLLNEIRDEHLVVTTVRARDAAEALLRIMQLKIPPKEFAAVVSAVLYQRLIRLLCRDCKVAYSPSPDVLKRLGIPAGKIEKLYRPPKPEELEKPCQSCGNLGYKGRTGIFELLEVNDQIREILAKQPKLELLKKAARASHQRTLQEEGIVLVAKGATSLQELQRVLKQ